ncbi:MAG: SDR family NAD(P)-dependent oxidoreductase, partial [Gluconacetobacter diazotrophicus]|nr:SDR family NAD(P)-dependent oxidoreductase [Gluconacetobacter diazotrophicus]
MTDHTGIALITGGSRGLGRSTAEALLRRGVDVVATFHSRADRAAELVAEAHRLGRRAAALRLDVADTAALPGFVTELRGVLRDTWNRDTFDFLVNNGGTGLHRSIADTTEAEFDRMVGQHLKGVFFS